VKVAAILILAVLLLIAWTAPEPSLACFDWAEENNYPHAICL